MTDKERLEPTQPIKVCRYCDKWTVHMVNYHSGKSFEYICPECGGNYMHAPIVRAAAEIGKGMK